MPIEGGKDRSYRRPSAFIGGCFCSILMPIVLFVSVFLIAACGLVYELIAGTLASYLLGDSIFQFSTVIGCYLFAMGIGDRKSVV